MLEEGNLDSTAAHRGMVAEELEVPSVQNRLITLIYTVVSAGAMWGIIAVMGTRVG